MKYFYDSIKFKRQTRIPEKDFLDYTLEEVTINATNTRKEFPFGTIAIIGTHRESRKEKIQSILIPRTQEEIYKKVAKGDVFLKIATLEKDELFLADGLIFKLKYKQMPHEGLCDYYTKTIYVSDNYFALPIPVRSHILKHEVGHMWELGLTTPERFWEINDSGIFGSGKENSSGNTYFDGNYGTYNLHESMAESFANYIGASSDKKFLKDKYPKSYMFIKQNIRGFVWLK